MEYLVLKAAHTWGIKDSVKGFSNILLSASYPLYIEFSSLPCDKRSLNNRVGLLKKGVATRFAYMHVGSFNIGATIKTWRLLITKREAGICARDYQP